MGLFGNSGNVEVSDKKVNAVADWFLGNSDKSTASMIHRMQDRKTMKLVMDEVEDHLAMVYRDGYKGKIEFDYCEICGKWELTLYHYNKPYLVKATEMIAKEINRQKHPLWSVNVRK